MLMQEDKPMNGESISFVFLWYAHMLAVVRSLWFTHVGWIFLIRRLILGSRDVEDDDSYHRPSRHRVLDHPPRR
jgi:hypothetical protein